jgi:hypothetical protein
LQFTVQSAVSPHTTVQSAFPVQSALQPPFGQSIVHVLSPVQDTLEPVSTFTLHVLPPPQVTLLFVPVESVHWLVPLQVVEQFDKHVPWQVDLPAHDVVHPVPHVELQLFLESQW